MRALAAREKSRAAYALLYASERRESVISPFYLSLPCLSSKGDIAPEKIFSLSRFIWQPTGKRVRCHPGKWLESITTSEPRTLSLALPMTILISGFPVSSR